MARVSLAFVIALATSLAGDPLHVERADASDAETLGIVGALPPS
jgi:hypothetical protein